MSRFDEIVKAARNDTADPQVEGDARDRVRQQLFGTAKAVDRLRGCEGFHSLLPAYLGRSLSGARRLLLDDHVRECVACRRAVEEARTGPRPRMVNMVPASVSRHRWHGWTAAACVAAALFASGGYRWLVSSGEPVAVVHAAGNGLLHLAGEGVRPIGEGRQLMDGEAVRTGGSATAVIRLADGSLVEMNERTQLSVDRGWRGTTIRLREGQIIVEAARQASGWLRVGTADSTVSVKGTVFSVNRGLRGTRVSVVEGQVEVDHGGQVERLTPGAQSTSEVSLTPSPVADEIAWSRNAARYLALLGEFNVLQKKLESIPGSGLRYQSRLLGLAPPDTLVYAAAPNAGNTLTEAKRVFDEQIRSSPILREWWTQSNGAGEQAELDEAVRHVQQLSTQLGDEVAVLLFAGDAHSFAVLAEARGSTLKALLDDLLRKNSGPKPFVYSIHNGFLIVSESGARLRQLELIAGKGAPSTPFRDRISQAYRSGVGWLFAANLEQIAAVSVIKERGHPSPADLGLQTAKDLIVERREVGGKVENQATADFAGARQGIASWIAPPGAMATLDFVTPSAGLAMAVVVKSPRNMIEDMFAIARKQEASFDTHLADAERRLGVRIVDDLAGPMGTEAAVAVDGAMLPAPEWKLAVEVHSPSRLQFSIQKIVEAVNREGKIKIGLVQEQVQGRTFYSLTPPGWPAAVHYTYSESYLVVGASRALVTQALQARQSGTSLPRSARFRSLLPQGSSPNFSAVFYHNLPGMLAPVVDRIKDLSVVTPAQRQAMAAVREAQPGLIVAYGEVDRITASTTGTFGGLNLGALAGLDQLAALLAPGGQLKR
jgi:hypothetical protein